MVNLHFVIIVAATLGSLTLAWLFLALRMSFETYGGAEGQVPVMAHAFGVAMAAVLTCFAVERTWLEASLPAWAYGTVFLFAMLVASGSICIGGRLGARRHRRQRRR